MHPIKRGNKIHISELKPTHSIAHCSQDLLCTMAHSKNSQFCLSSVSSFVFLVFLLQTHSVIIPRWNTNFLSLKDMASSVCFSISHTATAASANFSLLSLLPRLFALFQVSKQWSFPTLGFAQWLSCALLTLLKLKNRIQWCDCCCTALDNAKFSD